MMINGLKGLIVEEHDDKKIDGHFRTTAHGNDHFPLEEPPLVLLRD